MTDPLVAAARAAQAPGLCALLAISGSAPRSRARTARVYVGCNVENASYGLTICAERAAVCAAVAAGARRFRRAVVVSDVDPPAAPCGACRQVLSEFGRDLRMDGVGPERHRELDDRGAAAGGLRTGAAPDGQVKRGPGGLGSPPSWCCAGVATACQEELTSPGECPAALPRRGRPGVRHRCSPRGRARQQLYRLRRPGHRAGSMLVSNGLPRRRRSRGLPVPAPAATRSRCATRVAHLHGRLGALSLNHPGPRHAGGRPQARTSTGSPTTVDAERDLRQPRSRSSIPETIIDSIEVPDTLNVGTVRTVLQREPTLAKVALPLAGDGVLAIGVAMSAPAAHRRPARRRLARNGATFISYVTVDVAGHRDRVRKQTSDGADRVQHLRHADPAAARPRRC